MAWLSLLSGAFSLIKAIVTFFSNQQLISAGRAQATLQSLEKQNERIETARQARLAARADARAGKLHDDDGHKRD